MEEEKTISIKKRDVWKYSTIALVVILILGAIWMFAGNSLTGKVIDNGNNQLQGSTNRVEVEVGDAPMLGDANAPVTIVEFSDYQCPYCARFHSETFGQLYENYIQTGKVKFYYMDFPLSFHENAQKAAEAARCAREVGGSDEDYFAMHEMLFNQGVEGGVATFKQYAIELGLDSDAFNECLDSGQFESDVKADMSYGSQIGIRGTPGFFINGKLVSGAQPYSVFKQAIEAELKA